MVLRWYKQTYLHRLHWSYHGLYQFDNLVVSVKEALVEILFIHQNTAAVHETDSQSPVFNNNGQKILYIFREMRL